MSFGRERRRENGLFSAAEGMVAWLVSFGRLREVEESCKLGRRGWRLLLRAFDDGVDDDVGLSGDCRSLCSDKSSTGLMIGKTVEGGVFGFEQAVPSRAVVSSYCGKDELEFLLRSRDLILPLMPREAMIEE